MTDDREAVEVTQVDIEIGEEVFRDWLQGVGADNNPGEYEGECCAIEAAARTRHRIEHSRTPSEGEGLVERAEIVRWLRAQSDKGADFGLAAEPGTTKRAAFGGGSLALHRAADEIERGAHIIDNLASKGNPNHDRR